MRTEPPLLAPLFRSDGQARLLAELMFSDQPLSLAALAERIRATYSVVHREVGRLIEAGLLTEQRIGRTRLVAFNEASPLTGPTKAILLVSLGPVPLLRSELGGIPGVEVAFLYGSFAARMTGMAGEPPADIDVMVVGEPEATTVYDACRRVEDQVRRPINPTIMTAAEVSEVSGFLEHVRQSPTVPILGDPPWQRR